MSSVSSDSDHRMLVATLGLEELKCKSKYNKFSYGIGNLKDTTFRQKFHEMAAGSIRTRRECSKEEKWEQIKSSIKTAVEQTIGTGQCMKRKLVRIIENL